MSSKEKGRFIINVFSSDLSVVLAIRMEPFDKFDNTSKNKAFKEAKRIAKDYSCKFDHVCVSEVVFEV